MVRHEHAAVQNPEGLDENRRVSRQGGRIAGNARKEIETETGKPVITSQNAAQLNGIVTGMIEEISEKA